MKIVDDVVVLGYMLRSVLITGLGIAYLGMLQLCNAYENSGLILKLGSLYLLHISDTRILNVLCFLFLRSVSLQSVMHLLAGLFSAARNLR